MTMHYIAILKADVLNGMARNLQEADRPEDAFVLYKRAFDLVKGELRGRPACQFWWWAFHHPTLRCSIVPRNCCLFGVVGRDIHLHGQDGH